MEVNYGDALLQPVGNGAGQGRHKQSGVPCTQGLWEEADGLPQLLENISKFLLGNVFRGNAADGTVHITGAKPQI